METKLLTFACNKLALETKSPAPRILFSPCVTFYRYLGIACSPSTSTTPIHVGEKASRPYLHTVFSPTAQPARRGKGTLNNNTLRERRRAGSVFPKVLQIVYIPRPRASRGVFWRSVFWAFCASHRYDGVIPCEQRLELLPQVQLVSHKDAAGRRSLTHHCIHRTGIGSAVRDRTL